MRRQVSYFLVQIHARNRICRPLISSIAAILLSTGCAHVEALPDGSKRVIGFVHMVIPSAVPAEQRGAETLEVTTIGLGILSTQGGGGISIGYSSDRITILRNEAKVVVGPSAKPAAHSTNHDQENAR